MKFDEKKYSYQNEWLNCGIKDIILALYEKFPHHGNEIERKSDMIYAQKSSRRRSFHFMEEKNLRQMLQMYRTDMNSYRQLLIDIALLYLLSKVKLFCQN